MKTAASASSSQSADAIAHRLAALSQTAPPLCPADRRLQDFIDDYLRKAGSPSAVPQLPSRTLALDQPGLARELSLPPDRDEFHSDIISSYRVKQGVLHNPKSDRRTTQDIFHVAEGGLPIPDDKRAVPAAVFAELLRRALAPPPALQRLPYTSTRTEPVECFVSLLMRPLVCPAVPGFISEKRMETRFFAPGNLTSNLDFVESIFGNAGDPSLPENDAGLDTEHWTGHTGCVILAPHLVNATKPEVGLPRFEAATERQQRDRMCWRDPAERYNDGQPFKLTARDASGVILTIIADNYFGYCKKEVKTQISFAANLYGLAEEEHSGGALVYPSYDLADEFSGDLHVRNRGHNFEEMTRLYGDLMEAKPEGYAVDRRFHDILYISEKVRFDLNRQTVSWPHHGQTQKLKLLPGKTYVRPSGYRVQMEKPSTGRVWRLVGTVAEGTFCHKPCTVSGGGKSEISKPITDAVLTGPVFVADFQKDFDQVEQLVARDYSIRFRDTRKDGVDRRPVLSPERSIGSVIKLFTPTAKDYSEAYNAWLASIPAHVKELVFIVKRYCKPEWGADWRAHFSVDNVNGEPGNELKCDNRRLLTTALRVGFTRDAWRTFNLRKDFHPAVKLAMEDDISASIVVPAACVSHLNPDYRDPAVKFVQNCEKHLFQRPDDAIHRGYDKQTESDYSQPGNFFSNYEPLPAPLALELIDDTLNFDQYTEPMQQLIREVAAGNSPDYFVSPAHPRLVDGQPTKNPRYLQMRPDLVNPRASYLAEVCTRLYRRIPIGQPVPTPVNAVLPGRRNNPPDVGIRPLACYGPIHYMEPPELFMEFICSMTGKSPSTTGAGSEGALTKGPFNALPPIFDLNAALVSSLLTRQHGFVTAAGHVGPHTRVDHDISLVVPEIWCRMAVEERDPSYLIANGYLERCVDFEHAGSPVLASRLGWRITKRFVRHFFGRMFNYPHAVLTEEMLRPEKQDAGLFADGMDNIVETQRRVASHYFADNSIALACPPLLALLHIMRNGHFEGKDLAQPEIRALFTREKMLAGDWYPARLKAKQEGDVRLWKKHIGHLDSFLADPSRTAEAARLGIAARLIEARQRLDHVSSPGYLHELHGTLGTQPL
jgi:hypothetical protein